MLGGVVSSRGAVVRQAAGVGVVVERGRVAAAAAVVAGVEAAVGVEVAAAVAVEVAKGSEWSFTGRSRRSSHTRD